MIYKIYDSKDKVVLPRVYKTLRALLKACDKLDNAYGAYRYYCASETPKGSN